MVFQELVLDTYVRPDTIGVFWTLVAHARDLEGFDADILNM